MPDYVWVKDNGTGHQFPLPKDEADALGDGVRIDPKHPTHDAGGELLHPVYKTTVAASAKKAVGSVESDK